MQVKPVGISPSTQKAAYTTSPGFVVRPLVYSVEHRNRRALELLRAKPAIYVTGQAYSTESRRQSGTNNANSNIGKTEWVVQNLIPYLRPFFRGVSYVDIEGVIPIRRIMDKQLNREEIEGCFDRVISTIARSAASSEVIVVDECHWLFPSADENPAGKGIFRFDNSFSGKQAAALDLIASLIRRGKKFVFISWLHPQDVSLAEYYLNTPSFRMFFNFPVFELRSNCFESDG